jgi:hypothetical protein
MALMYEDESCAPGPSPVPTQPDWPVVVGYEDLWVPPSPSQAGVLIGLGVGGLTYLLAKDPVAGPAKAVFWGLAAGAAVWYFWSEAIT